MELLLATTNLGKVREFNEILAPIGYCIVDLSSRAFVEPPEETGTTFEDNAKLKARYYAVHCHAWALADDSGLAVDALDGKPGVHSARWASMHDAGIGDAANNALLLRQMAPIEEPRRIARFLCALALSDPDGNIVTCVCQAVEGLLLREARGSNGFGYDPLFLPAGCQMTTAQMTPAQKHAISHRGKAVRKLHDWLSAHPLSSGAEFARQPTVDPVG